MDQHERIDDEHGQTVEWQPTLRQRIRHAFFPAKHIDPETDGRMLHYEPVDSMRLRLAIKVNGWDRVKFLFTGVIVVEGRIFSNWQIKGEINVVSVAYVTTKAGVREAM